MNLVYAEPSSDWQQRTNAYRRGMVVQDRPATSSSPDKRDNATIPPRNMRSGRMHNNGEHENQKDQAQSQGQGSRRHAYRNEGGYCGDQKACSANPNSHRARRLSQDERRVLRHQLNEASQTIYRNDAHQ